MNNNISKRLNLILNYLIFEMNKFPYKGEKEDKEFAKRMMEYTVYVLNRNNRGQPFNDPLLASYQFNFYGHHLSWKKGKAKDSALLVYNYYKADKVIEVIRKYESMFNVIIIDDASSLRECIYAALKNNDELNYSSMLGLSSNIVYVPDTALNQVVEDMKVKYE